MARNKYARYMSEIKHVPYPSPSGEKPFREMLLIDATDLPTLPYHFEIMIVRRDGVRDGVSDVVTVPEEVAKLMMKRFRSGLPNEPEGEVWPPLYRNEKGQIIFRGWPMYHTSDEIFLFFGTDPENPSDLGGEVEIWLGQGEDAEKYIITKPSCVHIPAGLVHAPLIFKNVRRPFIEVICYTKPVLDEHPVFVLPKGYKPPK